MNLIQPKTEIIPVLALDIEHRLILSERQRITLLKDRQRIIDESILAIQQNFLQLGKALAEIKKFKLYKADPLFPSWRDYINHRLAPKLHQSTISDYIGIFNMLIHHNDFIQEQDLVKLGYKKTKLLKAKLNLIKKEKDPVIREQLEDKFKRNYDKIFKEFRDIPYTTFEKVFDFVPSEKKMNHNIIEKSNSDFHFKLDKKNHTITIKSKSGDQSKIMDFFRAITG